MQALDGFWMLLGDLLHFRAAVGGGQHVEIAGGTVHGDRYVILVQDVLGFRHQHAVDLVPVDGHRQDLLGGQYGFVAGTGQFDAAGLAAVSDFDLGLHHARVAQRIGRLGDLVRVLREDGARRRDPLLVQQFLGLVFVKIHQMFPSSMVIDARALRPAW